MAECIKCGKCIDVCSSASHPLTLSDTGVSIDLSGCNACGHCVAVCPQDALDHPLSPRQDLCGEPLCADEAERFLRYARSVRYYKEDEIPKEKLERLLTIGTYAQTGSNTQGVRYIVLQGRERIKKAVELFCEQAEHFCPQDESLMWLMPRVETFRNTGHDGILRGCTSLIVAVSDEKKNAKNAYFSCTFMALLAPSLGVGTCWAGMYETLACNPKTDEAFRAFFGVRQGESIKAVLMAGVPDVKFRRLVARNPLDVTYMDET